MKKPCNCLPPPPPPQKGPSEYIPSRTYPDQFDYMMYGGAPMHRGMGPWIPAGPGCCPPGPMPDPEPEPEGTCPPKIYRNPPDVEVEPGQNIEVEVDKSDLVWKYTVSAVQFPVAIDGESEDVLYGDGRPENPLGVYDFTGATGEKDGKPGAVPAPSAGDQEKFLRGDGNWATVPKQKQADWEQADSTAVDFINHKPGAFAGATAQAAGVMGFVPAPAAGENEMFLRGDGTWANVDNTRECTTAEMDAWIDEVENG